MIERIRRVRDATRRHGANNPYSASWLIAELAEIVEDLVQSDAIHERERQGARQEGRQDPGEKGPAGEGSRADRGGADAERG